MSESESTTIVEVVMMVVVMVTGGRGGSVAAATSSFPDDVSWVRRLNLFAWPKKVTTIWVYASIVDETKHTKAPD